MGSRGKLTDAGHLLLRYAEQLLALLTDKARCLSFKR